MNKIICTADLHYFGNGSDKTYHACVRETEAGCVVEFAYGRVGSSLSRGFKTTSPVPLEKAMKIYERLISEKVAKGYKAASGIIGQVFAGDMAEQPVSAGDSLSDTMRLSLDKESSGIFPQLLNPIDDDETERLICDPAWGAQEKKNGKRQMASSDGNGSQRGINRKGFYVPLSPAVAASMAAKKRQVILDGESIGNTLYCFGILELDGVDLRPRPYIQRFEILSDFLTGMTDVGLELVPLAVTTEEKRALYERLKAQKKEGIVFKRLAAPHSDDKPSSGGDHLKKKFVESASVIVIKVNDKRSIKMGVFLSPTDEAPSFVGNCTIPANHDIPKQGDIVEVEYLYAYRGGSLYQPIYLGPRDDIDTDRCNSAQLKYIETEAAA